MVPFFVVFGLVALGVAIVAWATRHTVSRPYAERKDQDTAWNDPITATKAAQTLPVAPGDPASTIDPFAHAPSTTDLEVRP